MASGGVWAPPYTAVLQLCGWVLQPGVWHQFDGEHTGRGVDVLQLPADRFLNLVYSFMYPRLRVAEGQTAEAAQKQFDVRLGVKGWGTPGSEVTEVVREPGAPWWWDGAEEASGSFLASMGVVLNG